MALLVLVTSVGKISFPFHSILFHCGVRWTDTAMVLLQKRLTMTSNCVLLDREAHLSGLAPLSKDVWVLEEPLLFSDEIWDAIKQFIEAILRSVLEWWRFIMHGSVSWDEQALYSFPSSTPSVKKCEEYERSLSFNCGLGVWGLRKSRSLCPLCEDFLGPWWIMFKFG